jgi:hypothetical protein
MVPLACLSFPVVAGQGDLETTFGTSGVVTTSFVPCTVPIAGVEAVYGVAVQSDGKIVATGITDRLSSCGASYDSLVEVN